MALLFLVKQDASEATIAALNAIDRPVSRETQILVDACSYAGTGNVLKIQTLLHYCAEHVTNEAKKEGDDSQKAEHATEASREL